MGDFNLHINNPRDAPAAKFPDMLSYFNLCQHVTQPTHQSGHTLDLVITRLDDLMVHNISTFNPCSSDHVAVIVQLHLNKPTPLQKTIRYRNLEKLNVAQFNDDLRSVHTVVRVRAARARFRGNALNDI